MRNDKTSTHPNVEIEATPITGIGSKILNHVFSMLVMFTVVLGISVMINSMFLLGAGMRVMVLTAFLSSIIFYPLFRSWKMTLLSIVIVYVYLSVVSAAEGVNVKDFLVGGGTGLWNGGILAFREYGFKTIFGLVSKYTSQFATFSVISLISSLLYSLFCIRKTRVMPMFFVVIGFAIPMMASGAKTELPVFVPIIVGLCGMSAKAVSERHSVKNSVSGITGVTAMVLAAILLFTPIITSLNTMKQAPVIFELISDVKRKVSAIVFKDGLPQGYVSGEGVRSALASKRQFNGRKIATVYSEKASPVYLRTWAGAEYKDNAWFALNLTNSQTPYGKYAITTGETYVFEMLQTVEALMGYNSYELGTTVNSVRVTMNERSKSFPLVFGVGAGNIASSMNMWDLKYVYDGFLYTDRLALFNYSTEVINKVNGNESFVDFMSGYIEYLNSYAENGSNQYSSNAVTRRFINRFGRYGLTSFKREIDSYQMFIDANYGQTVNDALIDKIVQDIFDKTDISRYYKFTYGESGPRKNGYISRKTGNTYRTYYLGDYRENAAYVYEIGKIVADYLAQRCKYSLSATTSRGNSAMEDFLIYNRRGYCVQFATAGALIMRRLGFSTRYAEGYIADKFQSYGTRYMSTVIDSKAHAWTEVWLDGCGWVQLEMTPGFGGSEVVGPNNTEGNDQTDVSDTSESTSSDVSESTSVSETDPIATVGPILPPVTGNDQTSEGGEDENNGRFISTVIYVALISLGVILVCMVTAMLFERKNKKTKAFLRKCSDITRLPESERQSVEGKMCRVLLRALNAYGFAPQNGEMPEDFAKRIEDCVSQDIYGELPIKAIEALVRHEYRGYMDESDALAVVSFYRRLCKNAYKTLPLYKYVWYKLKGNFDI